MKPLTCNQMILLLAIYRGTLRDVVGSGTYDMDVQRLLDLKLIKEDNRELEVTPAGYARVQRALKDTP